MAQRQQQEEILRFEKLTISFTQYEAGSTRKRKLSVISDLCGEVRQGEVVAVVGSSGSGKLGGARRLWASSPKRGGDR